jgi:translation initiation factor 4G
MTSIPQKTGLQPQGQSNTSQTASQGHSHASSIGGKTSPLAPVPAATTSRSYANATKKSFPQSVVSETATPTVTGSGPVQGAQHGKSPSISPMNGKLSMQQTPVPVAGGLTIVNGNTTPNPSLHGDHNRKPSVTISATGPPGYMPNGSLPGRPNLRFGSMDSQGSPAMGNPAVLANPAQSTLGVAPSVNPRVASPQTSPSPIPQPIASGGRPPSTLQGQGNNLNFFVGESGDMNVRA